MDKRYAHFDPDTRQYDAVSTGTGKSWLACALGQRPARDNRSALYQRVPKLFSELALARGDGRCARLLRTLARVDLLILDDWGLEPLNADARHDLLEILEERYRRRSTVSQASFPSSNGTKSSATRPTRTPSSIASFTTPTASSSQEKAAQDQSAGRKEGLTATRNKLQLCSSARPKKWA